MRKLLCSLGIALLLALGSGTLAEQLTAPGNDPSPVQPQSAAPSADPAAAPAQPETPARAAEAGYVAAVRAAATASQAAAAAGPTGDREMLKLKAQIKTVRLSLAETKGRLDVTEKDLATVTGDISRLRAENTTLRTGLAKAETASKKAEEEVSVRRQEMRDLERRTGSSGSGGGAMAVGLVLALGISALLAAALLGLRGKVRQILARLPDGKVEDKRQDNLRAQLKEEQQKAARLEEECKRLRDSSNRVDSQPGSKRDKLDNVRRELRDARASSEAQKRAADERIAALQAELAKMAEEKQKTEEALAKANEKLTFLGHDEPEETAPARTVD